MLACGILLGLGLGFLAGWLVFSVARDERALRREAPGDSPPPARQDEAAAEETQPQPESPPAARKKLTPDTPTGLNINREKGRVTYTYAGQRIRPRPLDQIDAALAEARSEKNWPEYYANILELIVHDSPGSRLAPP